MCTERKWLFKNRIWATGLSDCYGWWAPKKRCISTLKGLVKNHRNLCFSKAELQRSCFSAQRKNNIWKVLILFWTHDPFLSKEQELKGSLYVGEWHHHCTDVMKTSTTHLDYYEWYYYLLVLLFPFWYKFLNARKLSGVTILLLQQSHTWNWDCCTTKKRSSLRPAGKSVKTTQGH